MSPRERILVWVLACVTAAAALCLAAYLYLEREGAALRDLGDLRLRCERLSSLPIDEEPARSRLARLSGLVESAELRRSTAARSSLARFGRELMDLLASRGIRCDKYLVVAAEGGDQIELVFECGALDLLAFLRSLTKDATRSVLSLSIRAAAREGKLSAVLRVGR